MSLFKKRVVDEPQSDQLREFQESLARTFSVIEIQEDCDCLSNSSGEFGHAITNPIPVNGILGEFKYLHRLRCKCNQPLYFHRIGSKILDCVEGSVDVYETVCYEGLHWDVLFFHMFHPRRSCHIPKEYSFSEFHPEFSTIPIVIGTNAFVETFPFGLSPSVKRFLGPALGLFADKILGDYEESLRNNPDKFNRPQIQYAKLGKG